jgi:hypothetical protein
MIGSREEQDQNAFDLMRVNSELVPNETDERGLAFENDSEQRTWTQPETVTSEKNPKMHPVQRLAG